jgi:hypothetical protein
MMRRGTVSTEARGGVGGVGGVEDEQPLIAAIKATVDPRTVGDQRIAAGPPRPPEELPPSTFTASQYSDRTIGPLAPECSFMQVATFNVEGSARTPS